MAAPPCAVRFAFPRCGLLLSFRRRAKRNIGRVIKNEAQLEAVLREAQDADVRVVDLATMPLECVAARGPRRRRRAHPRGSAGPA